MLWKKQKKMVKNHRYGNIACSEDFGQMARTADLFTFSILGSAAPSIQTGVPRYARPPCQNSLFASLVITAGLICSQVGNQHYAEPSSSILVKSSVPRHANNRYIACRSPDNTERSVSRKQQVHCLWFTRGVRCGRDAPMFLLEAPRSKSSIYLT